LLFGAGNTKIDESPKKCMPLGDPICLSSHSTQYDDNDDDGDGNTNDTERYYKNAKQIFKFPFESMIKTYFNRRKLSKVHRTATHTHTHTHTHKLN